MAKKVSELDTHKTSLVTSINTKELRRRLLPEIMVRLVFDPQLTKPDALVLENLAADIRAETTQPQVEHQGLAKRVANGHTNGESPANGSGMYLHFIFNVSV